MRHAKTMAVLCTSALLSLTVAYTATAAIYEYKPDRNIRWNEGSGDFTFGKAEFDEVGFNAPEGSSVKLIVRHMLNDNNASEQWGVWFYDSASGRIIQAKRDPHHLLDTSIDEYGNGVWTNTGFTLLKATILDVLYSNASDWQFIIHEITDDSDNTFLFNRARLVVTVQTPIPGAFWLFGSALTLLMVGCRRRLNELF